jgi:hypothetical protein
MGFCALDILDIRLTKLEEVVFKSAPEEEIDDPDSDIADSVYHNLKGWINKPSLSRIGTYSKVQASTNDVRQLLFLRQLKGERKYGKGLQISEKYPAFLKAADKLADAAFFIYHGFHNGDGRPDQNFQLLADLHTFINNLFIDYRAKGNIRRDNKHQK